MRNFEGWELKWPVFFCQQITRLTGGCHCSSVLTLWKLVLVQLRRNEILPQRVTFQGVITTGVNRLEKEGGLFVVLWLKMVDNKKADSDDHKHFYPTSQFTHLSQSIRAWERAQKTDSNWVVKNQLPRYLIHGFLRHFSDEIAVLKYNVPG